MVFQRMLLEKCLLVLSEVEMIYIPVEMGSSCRMRTNLKGVVRALGFWSRLRVWEHVDLWPRSRVSSLLVTSAAIAGLVPRASSFLRLLATWIFFLPPVFEKQYKEAYEFWNREP